MDVSRLLRWAVASGLRTRVLTTLASSARAYPWMIRHGYTGCTPVSHRSVRRRRRTHGVRPRAERSCSLRMRYGEGSRQRARRTARPASSSGWRRLPEQLRLGGDFREAYFSNQVESSRRSQQQFITMRADLYADIEVGRFRAAGSIGYVPQGDLYASLTPAARRQPDLARALARRASSTRTSAWLLRAGPHRAAVRDPDDRAHLWARSPHADGHRPDAAVRRWRSRLQRREVPRRGDGASPETSRSGRTSFASAATARTPSTRRRRRSRSARAACSPAPRATSSTGSPTTATRTACSPLLAGAAARPPGGVRLRVSVAHVARAPRRVRGLRAGGLRADAGLPRDGHDRDHERRHRRASRRRSTGGFRRVWFFLPHMDLRLDGIYSSLGAPGLGGTPASHTGATTWLAQFHVFL